MNVRMVCLANSYKLGGRCVAGRVVDGQRIGPWVRPVGDRPGEELLLSEIAYPEGSWPAVLDMVDVPLGRSVGWLHQQENRAFDASKPWRWMGALTPSLRTLDPLVSAEDDLWLPGSTSGRGLADRVAEADLARLTDSLRFIKPDVVDLQVMTVDGRWHCRAHFFYRGVEYNFKVTDPTYDRTRLGDKTRQVRLGTCYLTVSLAEPFHGFAYKIVAAIVEVP